MRLSALLVAISLAGTTIAGDGFPPSLTEGVRPVDQVELLTLPEIDLETVLLEDAKRAEAGLPPRFAVPHEVRVAPATAGAWEPLENGDELWRLRISSPGALSLNLGFGRYFMPPGGELYIVSPDYQLMLGPYTDRDNESHRRLWTPVLLGDEAVLELRLPADMRQRLELELVAVNHGYTGFGYPPPAKSGSCNLDVVCGATDGFPQVDDWRDQIRSVAVYQLNGLWTCSGALVNNTAGDLTPYFLTANHCGINADNDASMVVYWNYQSSWCRPPGSGASGGPGDGSLAQSQTGATLRANASSSDFALVELDDDPEPAVNPHWAGWDRGPAEAPSAVAIHHPGTDEKRISFEDDPTSTTSYLGSSSPGDGSHIRVADWDLGTTEGGSSGSPLFDPDHHVVGQLHGGYAACGNDDPDWYGRVSVSWTGGGTAGTRLSDWLDPAATGATTLDGRNQCTAPVVDLTIQPNPALQGQPVTFTSSVSGGTPPYAYEWDFDGDGVTDSTRPNPVHTYTAYYSGNVTLEVTDSQPCPRSESRAMLVDGARLDHVATLPPTEVCGDGDDLVEPGEEWQVPFEVANTGNLGAADAHVAVLASNAQPPEVVLSMGTVALGTVASGAQVAGAFRFVVSPGFAPCGAAIDFALGAFSWSGGHNPGTDMVYTARTGGGSGNQDLFADDLEDPATWGGLGYPGDDRWSVSTGPGNHTAGEWQRVDQSRARPAGSTGYFALADSDAAGSSSSTSTILSSPVIDLAGVHAGPVTLELDTHFRHYSSGGDEHGYVEVFDGATWQRVADYTSDVEDHQSLDITAHALDNSDLRVRFSYQDASYDWWWAVDNVRVSAPVTPVCDNTVECTGGVIFADSFETGDSTRWATSGR